MFNLGKKEGNRSFFSNKNSHFAKYSPNAKDVFSSFIKDFFIYITEKRELILYRGKKLILSIPSLISDKKHEIVSKMFWGRGYTYKYFGILTLAIPLLLSGIFVELRNTLFSPNSQLAALASSGTSSSYTSLVIGTKANPQQTSTEQMPQGNGVIDNGVVDWYKVQKGDTIDSIAAKFHISADILEWANSLPSGSIKVGQLLHIVPVNGIIYTVQKGDTVSSIASTYKIPQEDIIDWNLLSDSTVKESQKILLPAAVAPVVKAPVYTRTYTKSYASIQKVAPQVDLSTGSGSSWFYSQMDPRWEYDVIGGGYSAYSYSNIRNIGCLTTDVAMIAKYYGYNITPATIAENSNNYYGVLFNWSGLGVFNVVPLGGMFNSYVNWNQIDNSIYQGHPVIVSVGYNYHYVVLFKKLANGTYLMNDPARGANLNFNAYFSPYSVTQAVLYTP